MYVCIYVWGHICVCMYMGTCMCLCVYGVCVYMYSRACTWLSGGQRTTLGVSGSLPLYLI